MKEYTREQIIEAQLNENEELIEIYGDDYEGGGGLSRHPLMDHLNSLSDDELLDEVLTETLEEFMEAYGSQSRSS